MPTSPHWNGRAEQRYLRRTRQQTTTAPVAHVGHEEEAKKFPRHPTSLLPSVVMARYAAQGDNADGVDTSTASRPLPANLSPENVMRRHLGVTGNQ